MFELLSRLAKQHEIRQFSQTRLRDVRRADFSPEAELAPNYREYRHRDWLGTPLAEAMERSGFGMPVWCGVSLKIVRPPRLRDWTAWADLILVEFPWQFEACHSLAKGKPLVFATHNVQVEKTESGAGKGPVWRWWRDSIAGMERRALRDAHLVLAVSEKDRASFARRFEVDPAKIVVVPNGADVQRYHPAEQATRTALRQRLGLPAGPLVIFPAPHRQSPILEAMKWVRRAAQQMPEVTFLITGAVEGAKPKSEQNLLFTGFVDDYPAYLRSADVLFCPIELGGGTKLKLIEAAAAGLGIAAFAESVRGTSFRHQQHVLLVDKGIREIAAALRVLLLEREMAARLGAAARAEVLIHHDWDAIAARLDSALRRIREAAGA